MSVFKKIITLIIILSLFLFINNTIVKKSFLDTAMYSSYNQKASIAKSINEEKVLIIGGSASNLGFDSNYLSNKMNMPVVNMAITAGIPLSVYVKMAELYANPGDIVFVVLENPYWYTDYYDITENYCDIVCVDKNLKTAKNIQQFIKAEYTEFFRSFSRLNDNINFKFQEIVEDGSIYVADSVDENGDFILHEGRPSEYKRSESVAKDFSLNEETADELKKFISRMKGNNISVFLSYSPQDGNRLLNRDTFFNKMSTVIEKTFGEEIIIGTPFDFLYDESWFFDTEYHLRYERRTEFTEDFYNQFLNN